MKDLQLPALGMAMTEGLILRWLRAPGDLITNGDPLVEIETEKSTVVIESPATGRLGPLLFASEEIAPVGACLVVIYEEGDDDLPPPRHRESPRQRRLAREQQAGAAARAGGNDEAVAAASRFRQAIAERVTESWRTIPQFCVTRELEAESLLEFLRANRQEVPELGITDLLCRALGRALGGASPVSIGLAVATPNGVVIPVLPDVVGTDLADLVGQRRSAVARATQGRADERDLSITPVASLSNLGSYGVDQFTGIVPAGQSLLMTVGAVAPRVIAVDGSAVVRPTFLVTLVGDHRRYDGADLARLLESFRSALSTDPASAEKEHS